jgi:hypothetical protein
VPQVNESARWGRVIDYTSAAAEVIMARAGFVFRFLKPCAVAALLALVAACGGDGAPALPEVVRVTVAGMPDLPLAPMQKAQLVASATYSDGAVTDVTGVAAWESTNAGAISVSPAGLATATGTGKAEVSATFAGERGTVTGEVVALPSAYLIDGLEYAFDYQLDAQGRVVNYRIFQREGLTYPYAPINDRNPRECTGSLRGSYVCSSRQKLRHEMIGQDGRLISMSISGDINEGTSFNYVYQQTGLVQFEQEWTTRYPRWTRTTQTLAYDALGRLSGVRTVCTSWEAGYESLIEKIARITLDPKGRLMSEDVTTIFVPSASPYYAGTVPCPADTGTWTYDDAGRMKTAGSTVYTVDADGWLTSRSRVEGSSTVVDTYAITRFGGRVAEEQFTQAEPSAFYTARSDSQRVRYEWGRLPAEPTFVPRALTGLNGADYVGIISSHHR